MIPIAPPKLINKGILVYCPSSLSSNRTIIRIDIYYNPNNPYMNFLGCESNKSLIWTESGTQVPEGTIFIYETLEDLVPGYYTINLSSFSSSSNKEGSLTVGVTVPTPELIIGLPYSIYSPIVIS
jgi:hypothetical protein